MDHNPLGEGESTALTPHINPAHNLNDTRLLARAVQDRWDIPDSVRQNLVAILARILADPEESARNRAIAAKVILAADTLNVAREKNALEANKENPPGVNVNVVGSVNLSSLSPAELQQLRDLRKRIAPPATDAFPSGPDPV